MPVRKKVGVARRKATPTAGKRSPKTSRIKMAPVSRSAARSSPAGREITASKIHRNGRSPPAKRRGGNAELEHFRSLLLAKRREILGDVGAMESEAFKNQDNHSVSPMHMADVGTDNFEQEFTLGLIESERQMLREIQEALDRIEDGTYGICVATGKPIGNARLAATPWAKYCIEYARRLERGEFSPAERHAASKRPVEVEED